MKSLNFDTLLTYREINCNTKQIRSHDVKTYLRGTLVESGKPSNDWQYLVPDTWGMMEYSLVCEKSRTEPCYVTSVMDLWKVIQPLLREQRSLRDLQIDLDKSLNSNVPNWRKIFLDNRFFLWATRRNKKYNKNALNELLEAIDAYDSKRAIKVFKDYQKYETMK